MSVPSDICSVTSKKHHLAAVNAYNAKVSKPDVISFESVLDAPPRQHTLPSHIEEADFNSLFSDATTVTKDRLQAISAPQAHAWLKVQPSPKLGLALIPDEAQVIFKWWLGLPLTPDGTPCPLCHHNIDLNSHIVKDQHPQVKGGLLPVWPPEYDPCASQCSGSPLTRWILTPRR